MTFCRQLAPVDFSHSAISGHLPAGQSFSGMADKGCSTFLAFYSSQGGRGTLKQAHPNPVLVLEPELCLFVRKSFFQSE